MNQQLDLDFVKVFNKAFAIYTSPVKPIPLFTGQSCFAHALSMAAIAIDNREPTSVVLASVLAKCNSVGVTYGDVLDTFGLEVAQIVQPQLERSELPIMERLLDYQLAIANCGRLAVVSISLADRLTDLEYLAYSASEDSLANDLRGTQGMIDCAYLLEFYLRMQDIYKAYFNLPTDFRESNSLLLLGRYHNALSDLCDL